MDRLTVAGLELWLKVGCTEEERSFAQRVDMDVDLELDLRAAGRNDDLAQTVDYAALTEGLRTMLTGKTYRLAETAAETAADWVLWRFKPVSVNIRLRKRALAGISYAEIEIRRP